MEKFLIYLEKGNIESSLELLEVAKLISNNKACKIYSLGINLDEKVIDSEIDIEINVHDDFINLYSAKSISNILYNAHTKYDFDYILISSTTMGRMIAPRLSMKLKTGLVADITDIKIEDDLIIVRPAFDGNILAGIKCKTKPAMMTVKKNVFTRSIELIKNTEYIDVFNDEMNPIKIETIGVYQKEISKDIAKSKRLVSGGGGISNHYDSLYELAQLLNAEVSASRVVVDQGIASKSQQVGQTGTIVSPDLYMAIGIHGTMHHLEGMHKSKFIIAVNTNKYAPMCMVADVVVQDDAYKFVTKLIERMKRK